ncbi:SbcC/MukB-like Walker B domain-containing protein [Bradyrhizobium sp. CCBAU 11361]|uniref:SbcC/MukB-like Walker B domain-containing protein n=1 Tax=Bradyrhizobium sp. CCBAU 11361 TaxID=1630812 RepID=UPI00230366C9|nr:SbcC/MukB-like Walker B domain-containing protein [Bradyrhizobium sp. CCBAU 11361]
MREFRNPSSRTWQQLWQRLWRGSGACLASSRTSSAPRAPTRPLAAVYGSAERRAGKPSGFALAMFDEAFSKMDGRNQRQMMAFYKKLGLQFVIAAPFEKRVAVLEHMDTIVEVDRIGEQSRASVVSLKEKAKRELMAIDPDLMSDQDLAARLAAE